MLLLLSKSLPSILRLRERTPYIGRLFTPRHCNAVEATAAARVPWAADNDAWSGFDEAAFLAMLDTIAGVPGCRFVSAPDVVADAAATLDRFTRWQPVLQDRGLPAALVAQDGLTEAAVPWDSIAALFIGGSTPWKLGDEAAALGAAARERGKWLHVGRVNTSPRVRYFAALGVDSIDGTGWARWTRGWLEPQIDLFRGQRQGVLW